MSTTAQRKAWNEAMRSAAGTAALPPALQPNNRKRRSDRRKKQSRRDKARKLVGGGGSGESKEYLAAAWMDALEEVAATSGGAAGAGDGEDGDDSYDEMDELEEDDNKKTKKRGTASKRKQQSTAAGTLPKRFKPRSLASILLEEVSRDDGVAYAWLETEARISTTKKDGVPPEQQNPPARKCCPVTGLYGIYTDPKTGIPYANLKALEQIRERPPPWMMLSGPIAYHEAVKSIRGEDVM